jgi:lipoate-protein ligase A
LKRFEYKVPGGKLLRAKVEDRDGRISFLQITGDFFLLPETDLEELESRLIGHPLNPEKISETVVGFFVSKKTTIAGASPSDFAHVVNSALGLTA